MGRLNSNEKLEQLKKGPWTREEDQKLLAYIEQHGHGSWRALPAKAGLERCGKSCRLRWTNYLRPDIKRGKFSSQEEKDIIRLHALLGNRWSAIATHLPKRTDNEIKNYWNTRLKKRLTRMGIDPVTHKPKESASGSAQTKQAAVVSHMAQWETARLEAEARLVRESKFLSKLHLIHKVNAPPPPPPPQPAAPPCLDVLKVWQATHQNGFFRSGLGSLESPTSTLNFSMISNNIDSFANVGTRVSSVMDGGAMCVNNASGGCGGLKLNEYVEFEGKMDNSVELLRDNNSSAYDYNNVPASMDIYDDEEDKNNSINEESLIITGGYSNVLNGDLEDNRSYWNELLNLVTSPMMVSHVF